MDGNILIVEDEQILLSHLSEMLSSSFSVSKCQSFHDFERRAQDGDERFDIIVLDRLLHGQDSVDLLPRLKRARPETKVLVLSAINTPSEKAAVLDLGADDYLAKPFDGEELVARLRVLLRRSRPELRLGNLLLDSDRRTVVVGGKEIPLQNKEFALLRTFIQAPRKIFNKAYLYSQVWEMSTEVESNVVETTINKLRRRLREVGAEVFIKNMRNIGYWVEE